MLHELHQSLPVETPRGRGVAIMVIDYGPEDHLFWVVVLDDSGEIWTVPNPQVRVQCNWTRGRHATSPIAAAEREARKSAGSG